MARQYEGVIRWNFAGQIFNTVLHYGSSSDVTPDFQNITDQIFDAMVSDYTDRLVNDINADRMSWREDIPGGVGQVVFPNSGLKVGTNSGSNAMGQAAMIVRKLGSGFIRPNKGRIYQPGVASAFLTDAGLWSATAGNAVESYWETVRELTDGNATTVTMLIKASNPTAPNTQPYTEVTALQFIGNPGTQRRRRIGSGQ